MKTKLTGIALAFMLGFVVIAMAQSQSSNQATSSSATTASAASTDAGTHSAPKPATAKSKKELTPDQIYKANCTRCHSELPTMDARRTATIVRHMRIRANLTEREAQAIFEYLKK
jgi:hypothetical protein